MTNQIENLRKWLDSDAYTKQKEIVNRDINELKQRVSHTGMPYALDSHASPSRLHRVDYSVFQKTPLERGAIATYKSQLPKSRNHKFELVFKGSF